MPPDVFLTGRSRWVILLSALSVVFTFTHSVEDFQYNIAGRFGLSLLLAAFLLSIAYAIQVWGTALAARGVRFGHWVNLALALLWFFGAIVDHLGEILSANPYRAGLVSKSLEIGVIVVSALWAYASARQLFWAPHGDLGTDRGVTPGWTKAHRQSLQ
ncbi:MAG: hypothetical protein M1570_02415 [Chloroflexi bacterium]|nr:hypothetical protein [Chloroflexota bacterium]